MVTGKQGVPWYACFLNSVDCHRKDDLGASAGQPEDAFLRGAKQTRYVLSALHDKGTINITISSRVIF
jgi:hypothetical protein